MPSTRSLRRGGRGLLAAAAASALALACGSAAAAKTTTLHCGTTGPYFDITAQGLTCRQARALVKSSSLTSAYSCTYGKGNPRLVSCHRGTKKVTYKIRTGGGQGA